MALEDGKAHIKVLGRIAKHKQEIEQLNKYLREIKPKTFVDVYDVLLAFKVADPMLQHIIKKALAAGQRGHKDFEQDIKDIYDSATRAYQVHCVKVQTVIIDEET